MGLEIVVARAGACPLEPVLATLRAGGVPVSVLMIDNALAPPNAPVPDGWRDVRLKTPAGTLSIKRRPDGIAVVAFGNADAALQKMQQAVADALR
jgi:hypothetical protein